MMRRRRTRQDWRFRHGSFQIRMFRRAFCNMGPSLPS
jgi:hypothetical protein